MVKKLASIGQASTVTIAEMIVLQHEGFAEDLVEDWQAELESIKAALHVFDARIDRLFLLRHDARLPLLRIVLDVALLQPLSVLNSLLEVLDAVTEGLLIDLFLHLVDATSLLGFVKGADKGRPLGFIVVLTKLSLSDVLADLFFVSLCLGADDALSHHCSKGVARLVLEHCAT